MISDNIYLYHESCDVHSMVDQDCNNHDKYIILSVVQMRFNYFSPRNFLNHDLVPVDTNETVRVESSPSATVC